MGPWAAGLEEAVLEEATRRSTAGLAAADLEEVGPGGAAPAVAGLEEVGPWVAAPAAEDLRPVGPGRKATSYLAAEHLRIQCLGTQAQATDLWAASLLAEVHWVRARQAAGLSSSFLAPKDQCSIPLGGGPASVLQ